MENEKKKRYILTHSLEYARELFGEDKSRRGFICPICGSGSGANGTGITTRDGVHFTCWAGCFTNADLFQITGLTQGANDFKSQMQYLNGALGLDFLGPSELDTPARSHDLPLKGENKADYTAFYEQCAQNLHNTQYHRGLTPETLKAFNVGFCPNWQSPTALERGKTPPKSPRLIIPITPNSYIARATDESTPKAYKKIREGKTAIFNAAALKEQNRPIFLLEGEIDVMSVYECGGAAIGLGGLNARLLENALDGLALKTPLLIALDNDTDPGTAAKVQQTAAKLCEIARKKGAAAYVINEDWGGCKDPNELLNRSKSALINLIDYYNTLYTPEKPEKPIKSMFDNKGELIRLLNDTEKIRPEPTGFFALDSILDGGLYPGLVSIGAISSLGKSAFIMQVADRIAGGGRDVIIFSLEMSKLQLFSRSISRIMYENDTKTARTANSIKTPTRRAAYTDSIKAAYTKAVEDYENIAKNLYIVENDSDITTEKIFSILQAFKNYDPARRPPIVVVDYIQILKSTDPRATDKQKIDRDITELKRTATAFNTTVIAISSLSRQNYNTKISLEAFKESGGIEYGCDVVIGMQLEGAGGRDFDVNAAKKATPRKIEVLILKNRDYITGETLKFSYVPAYNYFFETGSAPVGANGDIKKI